MNNIQQRTSSFFKELEIFCDQQRENKLILADHNNISNISFVETYRAFIDFKFSDSVIRDLFLSQLEAIQLYSPTSAAYFPFLCLAFINKNFDYDHETINSIVEEPDVDCINNILSSMFKYSSLINENDVKEIFQKNGFVSNFDVKLSNSFHNACVFNSGYHIPGSIPKMISQYFDLKSESLLDYSLVVYDGYIQEVSELNKVLSISNEEKEKFFIISRGSSQDVQYTCSVNRNMGKTDVLIFHADPTFWAEQSDYVCNNSGNTKYGSETGILLNTIKPNTLNQLSLLSNDVGIFIKDKKFGVNREASTSFFISENHVGKKGLIEDQLNFLKATLQQIATCGIAKNSEISRITGLNINKLTGLNSRYHPAFAIFRAMFEANKLTNKIFNIGYVIRKDN